MLRQQAPSTPQSVRQAVAVRTEREPVPSIPDGPIGVQGVLEHLEEHRFTSVESTAMPDSETFLVGRPALFASGRTEKLELP